jgi:hypothetical protein
VPIILVTLVCFAVSIVCNVFFWDRTFGASMPVFVVLVASFFLWLKRKSLSRSKFTVLTLLVFLGYLSACVVCYRNRLILYAAVPTIFFGLGSILFAGKEGYSFSNSIGVFESLIKAIFAVVKVVPLRIANAIQRLSVTEGAGSLIKKIVIGIIISGPFLVIFSMLFASADPIFEVRINDLLELIWDPEIWLRGAVILAGWFLLCGYVKRGEEVCSVESYIDRSEPKRNFDGVIVFVFLLLNNILFFAFILIQLEYLFGGEEVIRNSSFTYAEYVHKGFYEFWATVVLVSLIILSTGRKLSEQTGRVRSMVELSWIAMAGQTFVIIASGFKRIMAYEDAYGYTYFRILVALFLLFMAGVFALFIFKIILRKSLGWLLSCGLCLAFLFLIFVSTFSVDKYIAEKNVARYLENNKQLDIDYLKTLSADAYPAIERLATESVSKSIQRQAELILEQMRAESKTATAHWTSWNMSLSKAQK